MQSTSTHLLVVLLLLLLFCASLLGKQTFLALPSGPLLISTDGSQLTSMGQLDATFDAQYFGNSKLVSISPLLSTDSTTQWICAINEKGDAYLMNVNEEYQIEIDLSKFLAADERIVQLQWVPTLETGVQRVYVTSESNHLYLLDVKISQLDDSISSKKEVISQFRKSKLILSEPIIKLFQGIVHSSIVTVDTYALTTSGKLFLIRNDRATMVYSHWFENGAKVISISPFRTDSSALVLSSNGEVCELYPQLYTCKILNKETFFDGKSIQAIDANGDNFLALASDGTVYQWGTSYSAPSSTHCVASNHVKQTTPKAISSTHFGGKKIIDISVGRELFIAQAQDGEVFVWGRGTQNRLGINYDCDELVPTSLVHTRKLYSVQSSVSVLLSIGIFSFAMITSIVLIRLQNYSLSAIKYSILLFMICVCNVFSTELIPRIFSSYRESIWTSIATIMSTLLIASAQYTVLSFYTSFISKEKMNASPLQIVAMNSIIPITILIGSYISICQFIFPQYVFTHLLILNHLNRNVAIVLATVLQFICIAIVTNKSLRVPSHQITSTSLLDSMELISLKQNEEDENQGQL